MLVRYIKMIQAEKGIFRIRYPLVVRPLYTIHFLDTPKKTITCEHNEQFYKYVSCRCDIQVATPPYRMANLS